MNAAQLLGSRGQFRSCTSRAYYAAFSAVAFALRSYAPFDRGRETPPHSTIAALLERHLASSFQPAALRLLKAMVRALYHERIIADYRSGWTIDADAALRSRRDAYAVCRTLGVTDARRD